MKTKRAVVAVGAAGAIVVACGGEVAFETSVASSAPVSSDPSQFCNDISAYLEKLEPSIVPLACQYAVADVPAAECTKDYSVCTAAANAALDAGGGTLGESGFSTSACVASAQKCSATVSVVSQCISDYGTALQEASAALTPESACAGSGDPSKNITVPASCTSLPSGCPFGGSSSSSSTGPSPSPQDGGPIVELDGSISPGFDSGRTFRLDAGVDARGSADSAGELDTGLVDASH